MDKSSPGRLIPSVDLGTPPRKRFGTIDAPELQHRGELGFVFLTRLLRFRAVVEESLENCSVPLLIGRRALKQAVSLIRTPSRASRLGAGPTKLSTYAEMRILERI